MKILAIINLKSGNLKLDTIKQSLTAASGINGFDIFISASPAEAIARLISCP